MCGIPFRVIENPYYVNTVSMLKNLQPNYNLLLREQLSNNLLSEECIRVKIKINNYLEKSKNLTLGMKFFKINIYIYYLLILFFFIFIST